MEIDVSKCKYYKMARCPEGYACKYHCYNCYYKQLQQYKNALDEIEHICNDSNCDNTVCEKCRFNSIDCDFDRRKAVLQKIKEVKGNG